MGSKEEPSQGYWGGLVGANTEAETLLGGQREGTATRVSGHKVEASYPNKQKEGL